MILRKVWMILEEVCMISGEVWVVSEKVCVFSGKVRVVSEKVWMFLEKVCVFSGKVWMIRVPQQNNGNFHPCKYEELEICKEPFGSVGKNCMNKTVNVDECLASNVFL